MIASSEDSTMAARRRDSTNALRPIDRSREILEMPTLPYALPEPARPITRLRAVDRTPQDFVPVDATERRQVTLNPFDGRNDLLLHRARDRVARQLEHIVMSIPWRLVQQRQTPDERVVES